MDEKRMGHPLQIPWGRPEEFLQVDAPKPEYPALFVNDDASIKSEGITNDAY
jgi:hypothetical protein